VSDAGVCGVSRDAGRWFVSFSCYETEAVEILRTPEELAYELNMLSDAELAAVTLGGDRGIEFLPLSSRV
jgi:hypothetical protein